MHKRKVISEIIIGLLIISSFVIFSEKSEAIAGEIFVDDDFYLIRDGSAERPYETIQDAINAANDGDIIYVFGGTYDDAFSINKRLTLMGSIEDGNTTITYTSEHKYTVRISADNVNFTGFDITDSTNDIISQVKGALLHVISDNAIIQNCNFKNCNNGWGIYLDSSDNNIIRNNIFHNLKSGIYLSSSDTNDLVNNTIGSCSDAAVEIASSVNNRLYDNHLSSSSYGVYARDSSKTNVTNNTIVGNSLHGIGTFGNSDEIVRINFIRENSGNGIYLDSFNSEVKDNRIKENIIGITLAYSNCKIIDNCINESGSVGVQTTSGSSANTLYLNHFNDNELNANDNGDNTWYYNGQGNFWDDYLNVDKNFDGIGDFPYNIPGGKQDLYPLGIFLNPPVKPYDPSPADARDGVGLKTTLSVEVKDPEDDMMDVYFYNAVNDELLGVDHNVESGERAGYRLNLNFQTTFAWYVIVKDYKLQNQSDIWFFTTRIRPAENNPPICVPGGPYVTDLDQTLKFDAVGSYDPDGNIEFYRWNFGDDATEILDESPSHKYSNTGEYTVTLTVIDNNGTSAMNTTTVTVEPSENDPPYAIHDGPYETTVGQSVKLTGSKSRDFDPGDSIVSYFWDFGDGTNSTEANPTHNYSKANTYTLTLTVTDAGGLTSTASTYITVKTTDANGSPGFELMLAIIAVLFAFILIRKRRK